MNVFVEINLKDMIQKLENVNVMIDLKQMKMEIVIAYIININKFRNNLNIFN